MEATRKVIMTSCETALYLLLVLDSWSLTNLSAALLFIWNISASKARADSHRRTLLFIREEQRRIITHPPLALHKPSSLVFYKGISVGELKTILGRNSQENRLQSARQVIQGMWRQHIRNVCDERVKMWNWNTCGVKVDPKYGLKVPHYAKLILPVVTI